MFRRKGLYATVASIISVTKTINNQKRYRIDESFIEPHIAEEIMNLPDDKKKELLDLYFGNIKLIKLKTWDMEASDFDAYPDAPMSPSETLETLSLHYDGDLLDKDDDDCVEENGFFCELCEKEITFELKEHPLRHIFLKHFKDAEK